GTVVADGNLRAKLDRLETSAPRRVAKTAHAGCSFAERKEQCRSARKLSLLHGADPPAAAGLPARATLLGISSAKCKARYRSDADGGDAPRDWRVLLPHRTS